MNTLQQMEELGELPGTMFAKTLGEELRRAREAQGLSRAQFVALLPSGIGERTMLAYEHGLRQLTALRLIELCFALGLDAPTMLGRAMQRTLVHLETLALTVDLHALLKDFTPTYRPLHQWAKNSLNECPDGVVEVGPAVVKHLALFVGCEREGLAGYLAGFLPEGRSNDSRVSR